MCIADVACCGMPACANGKTRARGIGQRRRSRMWSIRPVGRLSGRSAPFIVSWLSRCSEMFDVSALHCKLVKSVQRNVRRADDGRRTGAATGAACVAGCHKRAMCKKNGQRRALAFLPVFVIRIDIGGYRRSSASTLAAAAEVQPRREQRRAQQHSKRRFHKGRHARTVSGEQLRPPSWY